jgi:hypothetical protein
LSWCQHRTTLMIWISSTVYTEYFKYNKRWRYFYLKRQANSDLCKRM